jgi:hypothetical protein
MLSNFIAAVPRIASEQLAPRIDAEVADLAEQLRRAAPYRTGALRTSVGWLRIRPGTWGIRLNNYGYFISVGHRVHGWGTAARPHRRYRTRGYTVPTWWIERTFDRWQAGLYTRLGP